MIAVVQRVTEASVSVEGKITGACGKGLAILLGVAPEDTSKEVKILAEKIAKAYYDIPKDQRDNFKSAAENAYSALEMMLNGDMEKAMNKYN